MTGFIHGSNNSSFELDNKFNAMVRVLEQIAETQRDLLLEVKALSRAVEGMADNQSRPNNGPWYRDD